MTTPQSGRADQGIARLVDLLERAQDDIRRLNDERAELFGRLGFYQAQLQQAQETIKALQAPAVSSAAEETAPQDPPTRPWWRFW